MIKQALLAAGALLPLAAGAQGANYAAGLVQAAGIDYTYVEASYLNTKIDVGPKIAGDGLRLDGSVSVNDNIYVLADYKKANFKHSIDSTTYGLGAGMHWPLQPQLDAFGQLRWVHSRFDEPVGKTHDSGLGFAVGLRNRINRFELQGAIDYVDLNGSETSLLLGGRYYLTDSVTVGAGFRINNDIGGWSVSLRAVFGR